MLPQMKHVDANHPAQACATKKKYSLDGQRGQRRRTCRATTRQMPKKLLFLGTKKEDLQEGQVVYPGFKKVRRICHRGPTGLFKGLGTKRGFVFSGTGLAGEPLRLSCGDSGDKEEGFGRGPLRLSSGDTEGGLAGGYFAYSGEKEGGLAGGPFRSLSCKQKKDFAGGLLRLSWRQKRKAMRRR